MPHEEKTLHSEAIYDGKVIRVTLDTVELENGRQARREVVHHHGGACVLAVTEQNEVYMVRQYRYAFRQELWELPAGKLEAGEDPFAAAQRELAEECGVVAQSYQPLGAVYPTVGYDTEVIYLWAAQGLRPCGQHLDEDEFLDVHRVPLPRALAMVEDGTICDSKTVAGLLKYARLHGL